MLGKLNTHEFAFGALTTSPHFGPARNPWSPDRDLRRLERRQRCRGRGRPGRRHARHGHGRLDPDTCMLLRRHRAAAVDRASSRTEGVVPTSWTFDTVGPIAQERRGLQPAPRGARPVVPAGAGRRRRRAPRSASSSSSSTARSPTIAACAQSAVDELVSLGAQRRAGRRPAARGGRHDRAGDHAPRGNTGSPRLAAHAASRLRADVRARLLAGLAPARRPPT